MDTCLLESESCCYGTTERPIVVGCIDAFPGSEKLAFLSNFTSGGANKDDYDRRGIGARWTKHALRDIVVDNKPRNVDVYNSTDTLFDVNDELSMRRLALLISEGVREMTPLDSELMLVDHRARPDHFIVAVSGRELYSGISYWCSCLFSAGPCEVERSHIAKVAELYHHAHHHVPQGGNVIVLVTQIDTIAHHNLDEAQEIIRTLLRNCNIPEESIVFCRRRCTWSESDIVEHDNGIIDAIADCEKYGGAYVEYLCPREYSSTILPLGKCTRRGCQHRFTAKSSHDLRVLLDRVTKTEFCGAK